MDHQLDMWQKMDNHFARKRNRYHPGMGWGRPWVVPWGCFGALQVPLGALSGLARVPGWSFGKCTGLSVFRGGPVHLLFGLLRGALAWGWPGWLALVGWFGLALMHHRLNYELLYLYVRNLYIPISIRSLLKHLEVAYIRQKKKQDTIQTRKSW